MKKQLIENIDLLKERVEELLDRANTTASELVLIEDEILEKLDEHKLYKHLNDEFFDIKNDIDDAMKKFSIENAVNIYKIFSEKIEFISGDISMAEALSGEKIDNELFIYNYITVAFCIKKLDLMLEYFDELINNVSKLK